MKENRPLYKTFCGTFLFEVMCHPNESIARHSGVTVDTECM